MAKERAKVQQSVWTQGQGRQQKAGTPAAEGQGVFLWASESSPKQWMNSPLLQPGLTASHEKAKEVKHTRGPQGREGPSFAEEV